MGVVDGSTWYGDIIDAGPVENFSKPPKITADGKRRSLTVKNWMRRIFQYHLETGWSRIHKANGQG